jgi:hypothetical protein
MKEKRVLFIFTAMLFLFLAGTVYSVSYTIASSDILTFENPDGVVNDPYGSLILSWDEDGSGISGGFCDLTLYASYPNGGKYEISLVSVISSNDKKIKGIWDIKKNGVSEIVTIGLATGLDSGVGGLMEIEIDDYAITAEINNFIPGAFAPEEIDGVFIVNNTPLVGAVARIQGGGAVIDQQTTDIEGKYLFAPNPLSDVKRVVLVFKNYDPAVVISGYIYVEGVPLVGATVMIKNQAGDLATITTDADGYYESPVIQNAVGAGENQIRTIILL